MQFGPFKFQNFSFESIFGPSTSALLDRPSDCQYSAPELLRLVRAAVFNQDERAFDRLRDLAPITDPVCVELLSKELTDRKDPAREDVAAWLLKGTQDPTCRSTLIEYLQSGRRASVAAANALSPVIDDKEAKLLVAIFRDLSPTSSPDADRYATIAMRRSPNQIIIAELLAAVDQPYPTIRPGVILLRAVMNEVAKTLSTCPLDDKQIGFLISILADPAKSESSRTLAANALANRNDDAVRAALLAAVETDPSPAVRAAAAKGRNPRIDNAALVS